jgi:LPS-assembly lipoprotein
MRRYLPGLLRPRGSGPRVPRNDDDVRLTRRARFGWALAVPLALGLCAPVAGCGGWAPLYADPQTGPAAAELAAIKVAPIAERIGQHLELGLRASFNPSGEPPPPQRYILRVTLELGEQSLGITTQGLGTLGRIDVTARFVLANLKTGAPLFTGTAHVTDSFDLLANGYSNVVAQNDAETRAVEQLRDDLLTRLTIFLQRGAAVPPAKT